MDSHLDIARVVAIGVGATVVMDAWLLLLGRLGVARPDFAFVGRWVGHLARGTVRHRAIAEARPVRAERALGWATHYGVGIAFAGLLVATRGVEWARQPTLLPALAIGVATVVAPLFLMQPAMGAGFAAAKTRTPVKNVLRSVANHAVFGIGLYLAARLVAWAGR